MKMVKLGKKMVRRLTRKNVKQHLGLFHLNCGWLLILDGFKCLLKIGFVVLCHLVFWDRLEASLHLFCINVYWSFWVVGGF